MNDRSSVLSRPHFALALAVATAALLPGLPARADLLDLHHIDLQINFDNPGSQISPQGGFNNGLVIDEGGNPAYPGQQDQNGNNLGQAGFYQANTQQIAVTSQSLDSRPAGSAYDFIGTAAGGSYYHLQQANHESFQNYVGFAGDDLNPSLFGAWNTHDARAPFDPNPNPSNVVDNKWMQINLVSLLGPASGHLSVWDDATSGGPPTVWFSSDVGSYDPNNKFFIPTGTAAAHHHTNWGFTEAGTYQMQVDVTTTLADGTLITGGLTTYTFVVGDAVAVPEPSSILLTSSSLGLLATWRFRRWYRPTGQVGSTV